MLYATKTTNLLKVPRHTDATITVMEFTNQFDRTVSSIAKASGDFSIDYTVPFYYGVRLNASLPLKKGTYTYVLKANQDAVETGTLQFEL